MVNRTAEGSHISNAPGVRQCIGVVMRDGVQLMADVYLPRRSDTDPDAKFPTILERTPYDRSRQNLYQMGQYFAARDYAVVVQDCRGRYGSEGTFHYMATEDLSDMDHSEARDGYDTVEWIAKQPWSDGRVGTVGQSYTGATQQALGVAHPPHLRTQVIFDAGFNYWWTTFRHGGAFTTGMVLPQVFRMAADGKEAQNDPRVREALKDALRNIHVWMERLPLRRGESPLALAPSYERYYLAMAEYEDFEGFWRSPMSSLDSHIESYPDIPICFVTSWFGHHAYANFAKWEAFSNRNREQTMLVCGHWLHGADFMRNRFVGEVDFGNESALPPNDFRLRWFDHHLKGIDTEVSDDPPVSIFVMGGGTGRKTAEERLAHGGMWQRFADWPPSEVVPWPMYLHVEGTLNAEAPNQDEGHATFVFDPADPVPTVGGGVQDPQFVSGLLYGGPFDQRGREELVFCRDTRPLAERQDVLVFRTDALSEPVQVVGHVAVWLWVSSSAPDTDFTAKLIDEYPPSGDFPNGFAMNLCDDLRRLRFRDGRERSSDAVPGKVYELGLDSMITANVFEEGHRIRLDISSSNWPMYDVNGNVGLPAGREETRVPAVNTVHMSSQHPSHINLTILPAGGAK